MVSVVYVDPNQSQLLRSYPPYGAPNSETKTNKLVCVQRRYDLSMNLPIISTANTKKDISVHHQNKNELQFGLVFFFIQIQNF